MEKKYSNNEMFVMQMMNFTNMLGEMTESYSKLAKKRVFNEEMSRDEYMVYDFVDMLIHFNAVLHEAASDYISPGYMIEKLNRIKSYTDTTLSYFERKDS